MIALVGSALSKITEILKVAASNVAGVVSDIALKVGGLITGLLAKALQKIAGLLKLDTVLQKIWEVLKALGTKLKDLLTKLICSVRKAIGVPCAKTDGKRKAGDQGGPTEVKLVENGRVQFKWSGSTYQATPDEHAACRPYDWQPASRAAATAPRPSAGCSNVCTCAA